MSSSSSSSSSSYSDKGDERETTTTTTACPHQEHLNTSSSQQVVEEEEEHSHSLSLSLTTPLPTPTVLQSLVGVTKGLATLAAHFCGYAAIIGLAKLRRALTSSSSSLSRGITNLEDLAYTTLLPPFLKRVVAPAFWRPLYLLYAINILLLILRITIGEPLLPWLLGYTIFDDVAPYYAITTPRRGGGGGGVHINRSDTTNGNTAAVGERLLLTNENTNHHAASVIQDLLHGDVRNYSLAATGASGVLSMCMWVLTIVVTLTVNLFPLLLPILVSAIMRRHHQRVVVGPRPPSARPP